MSDAKDKPVAWATYINGIFQCAFNNKENADFFVAASKGGPLTQSMPLYPESALTQAREEGRREGMLEAAEIARRFEPDERTDYVTYASDEITRASEGKQS